MGRSKADPSRRGAETCPDRAPCEVLGRWNLSSSNRSGFGSGTTDLQNFFLANSSRLASELLLELEEEEVENEEDGEVALSDEKDARPSKPQKRVVKFGRSGRPNRTKKKATTKKVVRFAADDSVEGKFSEALPSGPTVEIIPSLPEICIDYVQGDDAARVLCLGESEDASCTPSTGGPVTRVVTVIEHNWTDRDGDDSAASVPGNDTEKPGCDNVRLHQRYRLRSFILPRTVVLAKSFNREPWSTDTEMPSDLIYLEEEIKIRSKYSIESLCSHYGGNEETPLGLRSKDLVEALSQCQRWGLVEVSLQQGLSRKSACVLNVDLTRRALDLCHPRTLAADGSGRRRQRWNVSNAGSGDRSRAAAVHALLWALIPGIPVALGVTGSSSRQSGCGGSSLGTPITAQRVYKLVDNAQLDRALLLSGRTQRQGAADTNGRIPGLVSTLRGYQQHAVDWMLHRETAQECDDEWELAWVVLRTTPSFTEDSNGIAMEFLPTATSVTNDPESLYFCPHLGWLATSYESARAMTLGTDDESMDDAALGSTNLRSLPSPSMSAIKGGILAESMGLGKTVEVLACILGNPRPAQQWHGPLSIKAQRQLNFDECHHPSDTQAGGEDVQSDRVGVIHDMSEFGDSDSSDDEENRDGGSVFSIIGEKAPSAHAPSQVIRNPVTPDRQSIDEIWVDESVIGSCLCGKLIDFSHRKALGPVVLCESCNEPMHRDCAGFRTRQEMLSLTRPIRYRQRFTNLSLDGLVCDTTLCPCCVAVAERHVPSRATLIITPPAILSQWAREISRHTRTSSGDPLKTLVYLGLESTCKVPAADKPEAMKMLHPRHISDADIVLTTFDALMGDLGHSDENRFVPSSLHQDTASYLRKRKRYRAVPTPLLSVNWWRVCLDEAQRVETPTAASARMAVKLSAEHRWCVSGTPIGRGRLEDLYGLLLFLRVHPFNSKMWFSRCFSPSHPMVDDHIRHLLRKLFWRSTKKHHVVQEQMGIPDQLEKRIVLRASPIERHFYERLVRHECVRRLMIG
jgi:SNF2-related domain